MTDKTKITIDLASSIGDEAQDVGQLIQNNAFNVITEQVIDEIKNAKKRRDEKTYDGVHDSRRMVFFIDSTRGAGKSTFLKSVTKKLATYPNLQLLIELDPTKVETGEHVFVSLLYALNKLIEKQRNERYSSFKEDKYEAWRKQFKKLAGGLQLLDEKNSPLQEIDEEAFLDWGLERVKSGIEFGSEFKALIQYSCELFDKDAFVISIDDADTNFTKGTRILEIIRRYLDSSYLVTLITGDLQLYSHLVRDFYYTDLGENIFQHDRHRNEEQIKLIDHLETQYLKKLFPLHLRTHLTPLWDLIKDTEYLVKFGKNGNTDLKLEEIIDQLLKKGLHIKDERDLSLYKEFLLKRSLRSIIQLLQFCTKHMEYVKQVDDMTFTHERVAKGFRAAFRASLHSHQVDVNALSAGDINALNEAVFRVVLEDGEFDTGCYLRPQPRKNITTELFRSVGGRSCKPLRWSSRLRYRLHIARLG